MTAFTFRIRSASCAEPSAHRCDEYLTSRRQRALSTVSRMVVGMGDLVIAKMDASLCYTPFPRLVSSAPVDRSEAPAERILARPASPVFLTALESQTDDESVELVGFKLSLSMATPPNNDSTAPVTPAGDGDEPYSRDRALFDLMQALEPLEDVRRSPEPSHATSPVASAHTAVHTVRQEHAADPRAIPGTSRRASLAGEEAEM